MENYKFIEQLKFLNAKFLILNDDNTSTPICLQLLFEMMNEQRLSFEYNNDDIINYLNCYGIIKFKCKFNNFDESQDLIVCKIYNNEIIDKVILKCKDFEQRCYNHISTMCRELKIIPDFDIKNFSKELSSVLSIINNSDFIFDEITNTIINKNQYNFFCHQFPNFNKIKVWLNCDYKVCNFILENI